MPKVKKDGWVNVDAAALTTANKEIKKLKKDVQRANSRRVKEQVEVELLLKPLRDENEKLEKANDMLRELITDERQIAYNASIDILKDTLNESSFKLVMRCIGFVIEAGEKHEQLSRKLTKALENADMAHSAVCDENVELKKVCKAFEAIILEKTDDPSMIFGGERDAEDDSETTVSGEA